MRILTHISIAAALAVSAVAVARADDQGSVDAYGDDSVITGPGAAELIPRSSVVTSQPPGTTVGPGTIIGDVSGGNYGNGYTRTITDGACRSWEYGNPALFYNFYAPNYCGGVPAEMYLCPHPVPAIAGHTYYTYQPFMPHEFLYPHHRTYRSYTNEGRGLTRTSAHWYRPPVGTFFQGLHEHFRIPR